MPPKKYHPLTATGALDTPKKIRNLMRRVINHQLKGEIGTAQQSAINGSAKIALGTFDVELSLEKFKGIELELRIQRERHKEWLEEIQREKRRCKRFERDLTKALEKNRNKVIKLSDGGKRKKKEKRKGKNDGQDDPIQAMKILN